MEQLIQKAGILMEALPYIQEFRDAVVVVKFGGSVMEDVEKTRAVLRDILFMECVGMRPVVVHGGGKAISARLKAEAVETRFIQGLRFTCERTIEVVDDVLHHVINRDLVSVMAEYGGKPYALSGKEILEAERMTATDPDSGEVVDLGFVGEVKRVDAAKIHEVLNAGKVPMITPLGCGRDGTLYNINADMAACRIAAALKARKLVFLSDVPGILRNPADEQSLISTIRLGDIDALIADSTVSGGMVPKVRSAADALRAGTGKVHMIDGRIQHSLLLEIFTDRGIGTQIVP